MDSSFVLHMELDRILNGVQTLSAWKLHSKNWLSLLLLGFSTGPGFSPLVLSRNPDKKKKGRCQPCWLDQLLRKEQVDDRSKVSLRDDQWDGSCWWAMTEEWNLPKMWWFWISEPMTHLTRILRTTEKGPLRCHLKSYAVASQQWHWWCSLKCMSVCVWGGYIMSSHL